MGFWNALKQVWTIARHSIVQAARMRVVLVLALFLFILVPTLPFLLTTQNTRVERLQMTITYCVYLLTFLLGVLTLFLSANTLSTEIRNQHILLLDPKPVRRGVLLLGKWCGVMLIDLILLAAMMGATYGVVRYMARPRIPDLEVSIGALQKECQALAASGDLRQEMLLRRKLQQLADLGQAYEDQMRVRSEVLTARQIAAPEAPDIAALVNAEYEKRKAANMLEAGKSEEWDKANLRRWMAQWPVPPSTKATWVISGIPKLKAGSAVVLLFRMTAAGSKPGLHVPADYKLRGEVVINEDGPAPAAQLEEWTLDKPHTLAVPASVVAPDGTLKFSYSNFDENFIAQFPFDGGIQALYPVAPLWENFIRAGLLILMRLTFIAIVGIFASTFLSYPVAVLLNLFFFIVGYLAPLIVNTIAAEVTLFGNPDLPPWTPINRLDAAFRWVFAGFWSLFPNFAQFNAVPDLSAGFLITAGGLARCFLLLLLVRGGILAFAAWFVFNRRQLAAVSPTN